MRTMTTMLSALLAFGCSVEPSGQLPTPAPADDSGTTVADSAAPPDSACGNGEVEPGEACDDAGESATCDADCTLADCGDGTLNISSGEECDPPDDGEGCLDDCSIRVGNCHTSTPWGEVADSLHQHDLDGLLPVLPGDNIEPDWSRPVPELVFHTIEPEPRSPDDDISSGTCEPPSFWDPERIQLGSHVTPADQSEAPYCRIRASATRPTDAALYFANRARDANLVPVTGEPTWVRLRFPIPEGHVATALEYSVSWSRMFGSHPEECDDSDSIYDDTDDTGECHLRALDESESWDEEVPPGIFLLWGRATDCEG